MTNLLIKNGTCVLPDGTAKVDILVKNGKIAEISENITASEASVFDANGLHVLPGIIDSQVHFREPGNEHKEDLDTGTKSALLGGVTAIFEMPNTAPPTTTKEALEDKLNRANGRAWCHYAFFAGAAAENVDTLGELERVPGCSGVKIFMGSSTGNLLVSEDDVIREVLKSGNRRVAVHSEDENRLIERKPFAKENDPSTHHIWRDEEAMMISTKRIVNLARETGRPVHVLHITTAEEIEFLGQNKDVITVEVTPQHLTLCAEEAYPKLGTYAQMNPPIRPRRHGEGLWKGIRDGVVDVIGSDHAPHTHEEKAKGYPNTPSGMPGVQTLVPVMLNHVNNGKLSLEKFVDLTCHNPARLYGVKGKGGVTVGNDGDFTIVDMNRTETITNDWVASKCGWTPFDGMEVKGWPVAAILNGSIAMEDGKLVTDPSGRRVDFS